MSRYQLRDLRTDLRRKASRIALITSIAVAGVLCSTSGCSSPYHDCSSCGYFPGQIVLAQLPGGTYGTQYADVSGCATISTTANCGEVGWAGL